MKQKVKSGLGLFFKQGIKKFKTHGALFPSSRFLGRNLLKHVNMFEGICIIELGAGTGVFTRQILERLPQNGRLLVFEIDPSLVAFLKNIIDDNRVVIIEGDAKNMRSYLSQFSIARIDYVISGLPLGNFSKEDCNKILLSIKESLGQNGIYLQFQYLMVSFLQIKSIFDAQIVGYECRNIPPAFIYKCTKK